MLCLYFVYSVSYTIKYSIVEMGGSIFGNKRIRTKIRTEEIEQEQVRGKRM